MVLDVARPRRGRGIGWQVEAVAHAEVAGAARAVVAHEYAARAHGHDQDEPPEAAQEAAQRARTRGRGCPGAGQSRRRRDRRVRQRGVGEGLGRPRRRGRATRGGGGVGRGARHGSGRPTGPAQGIGLDRLSPQRVGDDWRLPGGSLVDHALPRAAPSPAGPGGRCRRPVLQRGRQSTATVRRSGGPRPDESPRSSRGSPASAAAPG